MDESINHILADAAALEGAAMSVPTLPGQPPPASFDIAGPVAMGLSLACGFIAKRAGDHWQTSPEEAQQIGEAVERYANYKWPNMQMTPGWELATAVGAFVGPRMIVTAMQKKKPANSDATRKGTSSQAGGLADTQGRPDRQAPEPTTETKPEKPPLEPVSSRQQ